MPPELPESRPELERLAEAIDRHAAIRETAYAILAEVLLARSHSTDPWDKWKRGRVQVALLRRLIGALSVACQIPSELHAHKPDSDWATEEQVKGDLALVQDGNLDAAALLLRVAPTYRKLRGLVWRKVQEVDAGEYGRIVEQLRRLAPAVREMLARPRQERVPYRPGRPTRQTARNRAICDLWDSDPQIDYPRIVEALAGLYPDLTVGVVQQVISRAEIRGELGRPRPGRS